MSNSGTVIPHRVWPCAEPSLCTYPPPSILPQDKNTFPTCPYISAVLLICSLWPWMIRQVEAPRWNETHPFPLSAVCRCNDLREDREAEEPGEMNPWTSRFCSGLTSQPALPPGTVCSALHRKRSGSTLCKTREIWLEFGETINRQIYMENQTDGEKKKDKSTELCKWIWS